MRFNILSLGLVATVFLTASVRAIPVGDVVGNTVNGALGGIDIPKGMLGSSGAKTDILGGALGTIDKRFLKDGFAYGTVDETLLPDSDDTLGNGLKKTLVGAASFGSSAAAIKRRFSKLSRRQLFQRRAETAATGALSNTAGEPDEEESYEDDIEFEEEEADEPGNAEAAAHR